MNKNQKQTDKPEYNNVIPLTPLSHLAPPPKDESRGTFQGIEVAVPTCPNHVKGEAKKHWLYMVKVLKENFLISKLDQGTLANLCLYYAKAKEAQELIAANPDGEYQTTPNGYLQLSPESVNFKTYSQLYNKLADKFAMTPLVRQKVKVENPNQGAFEL